MMKSFGLLAAVVLVAACSTNTTPAASTAPAPKATPAAALEDPLGLSIEGAVVVPADAPNEGVDFENDWIYDRFGRFRRTGGGTGQMNGRRYEIVEIELPNGSEKKIYFDITENWKSWKRPGSK